MSITAQKYLVGCMGFALLASVISAGYLNARRDKAEHPAAAAAAAPKGPKLTPSEAAGLKVYKEFSCIVCHGAGGNHPAHNANAQTAQEVPPLIHVADSYTRAELAKKIRNGVSNVARLHPKGPKPPLYMPAFQNAISDQQMQALIDYLFSLKPKNENLGF